jgi:aryl-alcohol dehydrogenase-like predicted oxidoreductase
MTTAPLDPPGGTFTFPGTPCTVHRLGYGAMRLSGPGVWGPPADPEAALAVLRTAIELGIDHLDTSDFYGPHVTNQLIKRALHPYRAGLVIATKVGFRRGQDRSWAVAASRDELISAVHDNLTNLGLEALDIVNFRSGDAHGPSTASIAEPLAVLIELVQQGLIKQLGISNVTAVQYAEARAMTNIVCVQNQYNLAHRGDDALIDQLARDGVAYVPFFPLGGFSPLQGTALDAAARSVNATPLQVALAWLLHRSPNILLIPGTSSVAHLRENLAAAALKLPPATLAALDAIAG